jgi:hypothetical protein
MPQARARPRQRGDAAVIALFSLTLFLSAGLMFLVQPMFARFILPLFGSTPAVWNASMLFFQTALLAGYLYAHESTRRLGVRRQAALHAGVLLVPLLVLPIAVPSDWIPPAESNPVPSLLGLMALAVGLPFFVVATTAPLLQRWLASTRHPGAADPYFLYRASNLGSVLGLLAYPLAIEPSLRLAEQGRLWSAGYVLLVVLVLACAAVMWRQSPTARDEHPTATAAKPEVTLTRRLRWIGLAFVPSSLMLGVTVTITTDLAPLPLLWALPLSLYLVSFVLVFAPGGRPERLHRWVVNALPWSVLLLLMLVLFGVHDPLWLVLPAHLAGFFVVALVCHGELARDRPPAGALTEFYLLISLGGALGGVFNALVAPVVFKSLAEYPIAIVLAALCLPKRAPRVPPSGYAARLDLALPLALGATAALIVVLVGLGGQRDQVPGKVFAFGIAAGVAMNFVRRPVRFGLALGAIALGVTLAAGADERELLRDRSFFGVYRVTSTEGGRLHALLHGTTTHGRQDFSPGRARIPASYYHPGSPIGRFLSRAPATDTANVAVIGLGTGSIACYAAAGERWTFYEIDPTVERIARDPRLFTYLRDCPGRHDVVLGDARLKLARARNRGYGLIVADAFSSDTVPVHLLTREALSLYRAKLDGRGVLAFNVSNRYVRLQPVLGNLAQAAGLACMAQEDDRSQHDGDPATDASDWVVMAKRMRDLSAAPAAAGWHACARSPGSAVWTDDHSNLIGAVDLDG